MADYINMLQENTLLQYQLEDLEKTYNTLNNKNGELQNILLIAENAGQVLQDELNIVQNKYQIAQASTTADEGLVYFHLLQTLILKRYFIFKVLDTMSKM